jgi:hypothetical protein
MPLFIAGTNMPPFMPGRSCHSNYSWMINPGRSCRSNYAGAIMLEQLCRDKDAVILQGTGFHKNKEDMSRKIRSAAHVLLYFSILW